MDTEKWERVDFKPQNELTLAHIVQSMTTAPPAWLRYADVSTEILETGSVEPTSAPENKKEPTLAVIENEKFTLIDSATFALRGIEQYIILVASVPGMVNDFSTLLLDYLSLYNSRTKQLILGAGEKVTAGLNNINTKHLALASQSLSFSIALIPYVREYVRRRRPSITGPGTGMAEYDRLQRLFQEHQSAIHDKLVDIIRSRATVCIRETDRISWDDEDEVRRNVSPYMETLTKEARTLQRVLGKYLSALDVSLIVGRVLTDYKEQWSTAFEGAAVRTEAGKARLLRDAELLESKLGRIDGGRELGAHIIDIVKAKVAS
ncbi:Vps54-like protein-domain-containing protein [Aspergillus californicus]